MAYNIFTLPQGVAYNAAQAAQRQNVPQRPAMPVTFGNTPVGQVLQKYIPQSAVQTDAQAAAQQQHPGVAIANKVLEGGYQPASTWRGKDATSPDGGFYGWAGRTYTTPEQEQQYRKQSRARMGIMAVADALRHLGNIYHTTKYAPSQQFNKPVEQEYAMYRAQKAERDKDNYAIQQQQLAQAKWEADQAYKQATLGWRAKDYAIKERAADRADAKAKQDQENWQKTFDQKVDNDKWNRDFKTRQQESTEKYRDANLEIANKKLAISFANLQETRAQHAWTRQNGGGGTAAAGKQKVFFSGKFGDVSRSQNLTLDEGVSMVKQMRDMGWVTPQKYNEYMSALNNGDANSLDALLNGRVGAGGKGATGGIIQAALQYHPEAATWLNKHYGFVVQEVRTPKKAAAPQKPAAAAQKPAAAAQKPAAKKPDEKKKKKGDYSGFSIHNNK